MIVSTENEPVAQPDRAAQIDALLRAEMLPTIQESIDAFRRDLPELLNAHRGKWVAYHGDEQIGFGRTETELYQECFRQGLTRNDFIVGFVEPGAFDPNEEFEASMDV